ncbi:nucleotidyltransferase family protein [Psychrobacter sp. B38]|uniref:nucleotidyltransferase family protein n=1 Tax=Psychrobacter sp. B38 TaxID=3143538 RepID=UPI00320D3897
MPMLDHALTSNHAVIILASGLSQRLGQKKQLLYKNGKPLISHMTTLALTGKPQTIIVVIPDNNPAIEEAIAPLCLQYPVIQTVKNPQPDTGMAHSLYLGIETLSAINLSVDRVLIMGVDQILLDETHLTALLTGSQAVVASGYHNWTPADKHVNDPSASNVSAKNIIGLPLVVDEDLLKQWQSVLAGDKGLRHLIRRLPSSQIRTVTNAQLSYDIDTPEQLVFAQKKGWLDR